MKILVFAQFAGAPHYGMVFGHYYLAREWVRAGHEVTIIAARFSHTRFTQPPNATECIDGINYVFLNTPSYRPANHVGRMLAIISYSAQAYGALRHMPKPDIVICSSHHPFAIHPAHAAAKRTGAKLVFEVRDLWPRSLVEVGGISPSHPVIRAMQFSEDYAYRHADRVVSVLPRAADYMVAHGMQRDRFVYVPNGSDLDAANGNEKLIGSHASALDDQKRRGRFLIGYSGAVGRSNDVATLLKALAKCATNRAAAAILGGGPQVEGLRQLAGDLGLGDRVVFLDPVPKGQVMDFLRRMDIAYMGLRPLPIYEAGVSLTKLNDYMLAERPILGAVEGADDAISDAQCGIVCPAEDVPSVARAIDAFAGMSADELAAMGKSGRKWVAANRDYRVLAARFLDGLV